MNIFYLSDDVEQCARYHVDKHVVKMILEYSQLLSTAHRVMDGYETSILTDKLKWKTSWKLTGELDSILYSATHINHPSAIWVRKSASNYNWLHMLLAKLCAEYTIRYGKVHKVQRDGLLDSLHKEPKNISKAYFTEPPQCMPDEYKVLGDTIQAYRNYYIGEKKNMAQWKNLEIPSWYA